LGTQGAKQKSSSIDGGLTTVKRKLRIVFLGLAVLAIAAVLPILAPAHQLTPAPQPNNGSSGQPHEDPLKDIKEITDKAKENKWLTIIASVIGLIGTGVPILTKTFESVSLRSRRKQDLDRIQDLTDLMKKIKEEEVLNKSTLDAVCDQIDAEIQAALAGLANNRKRRELVLEKRKTRHDPDLTFTSSALLLFRPHGIGAWIAHLLAYFWAFWIVIFSIATLAPGDRLFSLGLTVFLLFLFLLSRMWALRERRVWRTTHPAALGDALQIATSVAHS
jgi:hypothetical protein